MRTVVVVLRTAPSGSEYPCVAAATQDVADAYVKDQLAQGQLGASDFDTTEVILLEDTCTTCER